MPAPQLTAERLVGLTQDLRAAGLPVGVDQSELVMASWAWIDQASRSQVRNSARAVLVRRREDLAIFDEHFERLWPDESARASRPRRAPDAPRYDSGAQHKPALVSYMAEKAAVRAEELDLDDRQGTWSAEERIQRRDFVDLSPAELREVERFLVRMRWPAAQRRTRRRIAHRCGDQLDLRRILREASRHGGQIVSLTRRRRKIKARPLVLLADISGSMELYSRILLQFFHSVGRSLPDVESFVFGTRLSRITGALRTRHLDHALRGVADEVVDWAGGTRIGDCLATFNRVWGRRVLRRGALVVVVSDGWDRGDPAVLGREMRFLHDRCHRLLWLNPLLGATSYQPVVEGMTAALPYVDDFLPVHNLQSLTSLARHLASIPSSRTGAHSIGGSALGRRIRSEDQIFRIET